GLLKEEMRRLGSYVIRAADATRVPAGGALAVDRERFADLVTTWLRQHPRIRIVEGEVTGLPEARPLVIATGPLTGDALARDLERFTGGRLAYYDAIAPIVSADSIDRTRVFEASRYDKGAEDEDRAAYLNCPLDREQYEAFVTAVLEAEKVPPRDFEEPRYFEGCLPIEVMAARGPQTLAFGPMKPVGLVDPRTSRRPYAVVQLRREDEAGSAYNLVGFQTRMTWPEQARVLRTLPGLEQAEFLRYGAVHRNTFVDSPRVLDGAFGLRGAPSVYLAGQIAGTEGYVESAACGILVAEVVAARHQGREPRLPPPTTAHGGLLHHLSRPVDDFQPSNINFSLLPPLEGRAPRDKRARQEAIAARALADLGAWLGEQRAVGEQG
ncbi:MAG: methylenetetrahydrofolate--tRNA-(uracil(54)-C(5))-methyltransferase (FADH(2)-oxidizing) TrmFO, partial [Deltaproteobacteria bacterium]|nr:methylenetetrahydrofolate--tRNA-(uracil(54)-C(5))-methyltransferase (FADH(2)-oxidizing) TrmFO [Deltaproteobacteria bacterium]